MKLPGRLRLPSSLSTLRRPWIVPVAAAGLLAVALGGWWLTRGPRSTGTEAETAETKAAAGRRAALKATMDPMAYVTARKDLDRSDNIEQLIQAYGAWASRGDATEARATIVSTLMSHPRVQVGLEALLRAVDGDQTPRKHDPMWNELVSRVAARWDAETFPYGRDLVHLETREKARELVLESLAATRPEALTPDQRTHLASDLIDVYPSLRPDQKPRVDRALHALAGDDVVQILAGRGLKEGDLQLKVAAERQRALDEWKRKNVQEAPAEE